MTENWLGMFNERVVQHLVRLTARGRCVLAPHLHEPHRNAQGVPDETVAAHQLDPAVAAVTVHQLDGVHVGLAHPDRLVILLLAHPTS